MRTTLKQKISQIMTDEIDIPVGIVNFLQKRNWNVNSVARSRYLVTDNVRCQRKAFYKLKAQELGDTK